jgi:hypothetical protein
MNDTNMSNLSIVFIFWEDSVLEDSEESDL